MPTSTTASYQPQRTPERVSKSHRLRRWKQSQSSQSSSGRLGAAPRNSPDSVVALHHDNDDDLPPSSPDKENQLCRLGGARRLFPPTSRSTTSTLTAARRPPPRSSSLLFRQFLSSPPPLLPTTKTKKRRLPTISELCRAILPIQTLVRSYLAQCRKRRRLEAVSRLQSVLRGWIVQRSYRRVFRGIVAMQSVHRGNVRRGAYQRILETTVGAVLVLQRNWRIIFSIRFKMVVRIQAAWRGWMERRGYVTVNRGVTALQKVIRQRMAVRAIQSHIRGFIAAKRYRSLLNMVRVSQGIVRRWIGRRAVERKRREHNIAADKIGAAWRGVVMRREYVMTVGDLILVQSIVRRRLSCLHVNHTRLEREVREEAATKISRRWRGMKCRSAFKRILQVITFCQAVVRQNMASSKVEEMRQEKRIASATIIQSRWRSYSTSVEYMHALLDVVAVQSAARKLIARRKLKEELNSIKNVAATRISSSWRGFICCSEYKQTVEDIIICQSIVRRNMVAAQSKVLRQERRTNSATIIQSHWRARMTMDTYILTLVDIVLVQSLARRLAARRCFDRMREQHVKAVAATKISSQWRRFYCSRSFECTVGDIIICQSVFRRNVAMAQTQWLLHTRHEEACAGFIQEIWRAYVARERFVRVVSKIDRPKESKSATEIARAWKAFTAQRKHASIVKDVTLCQTVIRRNLATKEVHFFRVRVCNTAAVIIQSKWRSWMARKHYRRIINCFISLQCAVRKHCARKSLLQLKFAMLIKEVGTKEVESVTKIAAMWRGFYCRNQHARTIEASKKMEQMRLNSIHNIQAAWRGYVAKAEFKRTVSKFVLIQTLVRRLAAQKYLQHLREAKYQQESAAATKIVYFLKCFVSVRDYKVTLKSVVICQSLVRRCRAIRQVTRVRLQMQVEKCTIIQSAWRSHAEKMKFKHNLSCIVIVQCLARTRFASEALKLHAEEKSIQVAAAGKIAPLWRTFLCSKRHARTSQGVIHCQALARRYLVIKSLAMTMQNRQKKEVISKMHSIQETESRASTNISKYWRRANCKFARGTAIVITYFPHAATHAPTLILYMAIITCQSVARHLSALRQMKCIHSAVCIQTGWRSYAVKSKYLGELSGALDSSSVLNAQTMFTTEAIRSEELSHSNEQEVAAAKIQTSFRRHLCRTQLLRVVGSIIICQSVFRRWKAIRLAQEFRCYKNQGPKDIFEFIRTRHSATTKIQQTYQDYSNRHFELAYQDYLSRLNKSLDESTANITPSLNNCIEDLEVPVCELAVERNGNQVGNLDADVEDLLLAEEMAEPTPLGVTETIVDAPKVGVTFDEEENITYVIQDKDDANLESQCFDGSRCGLSDGVHEILMQSGKFLYDCIGDPANEETAEDLVTVMELGEEAAFCCWKKTTPSNKADEEDAVIEEENSDQTSAMLIQSKWRNFQHQRAKSSKNLNQNAMERPFALGSISPTKKYSSPTRKRVAKSGQIETLLNDQNGDDESLTDYCETESSIDGMSDVGEGLSDDKTNSLDLFVRVQTISKIHRDDAPGMLGIALKESAPEDFSSTQ